MVTTISPASCLEWRMTCRIEEKILYSSPSGGNSKNLLVQRMQKASLNDTICITQDKRLTIILKITPRCDKDRLKQPGLSFVTTLHQMAKILWQRQNSRGILPDSFWFWKTVYNFEIAWKVMQCMITLSDHKLPRCFNGLMFSHGVWCV